MSLGLQARRPLLLGLLAAAMAQGVWAEEAQLVAEAEPVAEVAMAEAEAEESAHALTANPMAADDATQIAAPADQAAADADPPAATPPVADAAAAPDDAAADPQAETAPASSRDPFESFNRKVYAFNDVIDEAALRPLAEGYRRAVPELARTGVDNFFGNLSDIWSALNKLLQGKVMQSAQMTLRVATNTVFGLGGLLDPATEFGLERQPEDFGQTLGVWGVPAGPYLVLPLLGPSTARDTAALPLDRVVASPSRYLGGSTNAQVGVTGLQLVAVRAGLLSASKLLGDVALDKYSFLRDAYLARRRSLVYDGNPPDEDEGNGPR